MADKWQVIFTKFAFGKLKGKCPKCQCVVSLDNNLVFEKNQRDFDCHLCNSEFVITHLMKTGKDVMFDVEEKIYRQPKDNEDSN